MNLIQRATLLSALFLSVTLAPVIHAGSLSAKEQAMVDWIDAHTKTRRLSYWLKRSALAAGQ